MHKVILVEDHHVVREGMKFLLSTNEHIEVIKDFSNGHDTLEFLKKDSNVDVIITDLVMPEMDGIELTRLVKHTYPSIKVLVLSSYTTEEYIRPVFKAKADGYIIKEMEADDLIQSILDVVDGKDVVHPNIKKVMDNQGDLPHHKNALSAREVEVLKEMVKGKSNKEISESLFVSEKTVKTHVSHILFKLEVNDRTKAVIYALKHHIVDLQY